MTDPPTQPCVLMLFVLRIILLFVVCLFVCHGHGRWHRVSLLTWFYVLLYVHSSRHRQTVRKSVCTASVEFVYRIISASRSPPSRIHLHRYIDTQDDTMIRHRQSLFFSATSWLWNFIMYALTVRTWYFCTVQFYRSSHRIIVKIMIRSTRLGFKNQKVILARKTQVVKSNTVLQYTVHNRKK